MQALATVLRPYPHGEIPPKVFSPFVRFYRVLSEYRGRLDDEISAENPGLRRCDDVGRIAFLRKLAIHDMGNDA